MLTEITINQTLFQIFYCGISIDFMKVLPNNQIEKSRWPLLVRYFEDARPVKESTSIMGQAL